MSAGGSAQIKPEILAKNIELKLSGFKISGQDLKTPTKDLVIAYYTRVMEEFGVDFGPSYRLNDIAHAVKLYHIVAYVFSKLGIRLFTFDDIMNPAFKRTLQLFAIMDNFHSFADQQAHEVSKLQEKREARLTTLRSMTRAKNELLERENQQAVHRATRLEQGHQLQEHMEELKVAKATAMEKKHQLHEATKIIEGKVASAKNSVGMLSASVSQMDEELAQLDKRIVTKSREELQQMVVALKATLSSLEEDLRVQNSGRQQKVERVRSMEAERANLQDSNHDLEQVWCQHCEEKEMSATLHGVLQETESVEAAVKLVQQQLCAEEEEWTKLQKLHDKAKFDFNSKMHEFQDDLENLKKEFADLRKSQEDSDLELANVHEQTSAIAHKIEEGIEAIKIDYKQYEEACERYKLLVKCYAEEILENLKNFQLNFD